MTEFELKLLADLDMLLMEKKKKSKEEFVIQCLGIQTLIANI